MNKPTITDLYRDIDSVIVIIDEWYRYVINESRLLRWLKDKGALSWISDYERNGEHHQESGEMTFEEWFESNWVEIDLIKAIADLGIKSELIN